jgi:LPS O-antigen subunit length determinant protein (WzzB/FepE family)
MFLFRWLYSPKVFLVLFLIAIAASGSAYYFYHQNKKTTTLLKNPEIANKQEVDELTSKVSLLMELPKDEQPTLITVVDKEKLKDQSFFDKAENGDKVLVYTQSKKAILYRPSTNKIVEVGPVSITPNQTFKAALYNGTDSASALEAMEKTFKDKIANVEIVKKVDAKSQNYSKTLVIDLKGDKKDEATQLAQFIDGEVGQLPSGETKPDADFLVIIAK